MADSELEALKAQVAGLFEQQQAAQVQGMAKTLGFKNPAHAHAIIKGQLQPGATNAQALLEALKASDSYLLEPTAPADAGQQQPQSQPVQQQARTGLMNAAQSATGSADGVSWETIRQNKGNIAWIAANQAKIEAFMANPANHAQRR